MYGNKTRTIRDNRVEKALLELSYRPDKSGTFRPHRMHGTLADTRRAPVLIVIGLCCINVNLISGILINQEYGAACRSLFVRSHGVWVLLASAEFSG